MSLSIYRRPIVLSFTIVVCCNVYVLLYFCFTWQGIYSSGAVRNTDYCTAFDYLINSFVIDHDTPRMYLIIGRPIAQPNTKTIRAFRILWNNLYHLSCDRTFQTTTESISVRDELSSVTELFQSLDQSSGTPSLSPPGQPTTFTRSNVY